MANPDGSYPVRLSGTAVMPVSIDSALGRLNGAVDLGAAGRGTVNLAHLPIDFSQFCLRIVARAKGPVLARQNLVESSYLPFSLFLDQGPQPGTIAVWASVRPSAHRWQAASTRFGTPLAAGTWYTIDLACDMDTVAVAVDGVVVAVQAFPDGRMAPMTGGDLFIGTWVDGARNHFNGEVAALQLWAGIPESLAAQLDERRSHPEWFVSHKRLSVAASVNLGAPTAAIGWDPIAGAYYQPHERGGIMYRDGLGTAFELHGAIHASYWAHPDRGELGYLTSDEGPASAQRGGRKNTFIKGAIYWSAKTGAVPVTDRIFLGYEHLEGVDLIGFPLRPRNPVPGGFEPEFDSGRMYHKAEASVAHEVHGAILERYLQLGGVSAWGFPVGDEQTVRSDGMEVGRASRFERCTIYWSAASDAFEIDGDLRRYYECKAGGPAGKLGFPTSDTLPIEGMANGLFNTFQNGALCWFGSYGDISPVPPFRIRIGRLDTYKSESFGMGDNDLYFRQVKLEQSGQALHSARYPQDSAWSNRNCVDLDITLPPVIVPNRPDAAVTFTAEIWAADPGGVDHLGTLPTTLGPANARGFRESQGNHSSGRLKKVRSLTWSVTSAVDLSQLSDARSH